jgi:hypothetical protein
MTSHGTEVRGAGKIKAFLAISQAVLAMIAAGGRIFGDSPTIVPAFLLAFFLGYVGTDMVRWRRYLDVFVLGLITSVVAGFWFMGIMTEIKSPFFPPLSEPFRPGFFAYCAMAAWIAIYAIWDMLDARINSYADEVIVDAGAVVMIVGVCISLYATARLLSSGVAEAVAIRELVG